MQEYNHALKFEDENISEFVKVKRNEDSKTYMRVQCLIYTETIRKLHVKLFSSRQNAHCSFSTFIINTKIINVSIKSNFFILSTEKSFKMLPRHNGIALVSGSFALNYEFQQH